ncbi:hypothetical protein ACX1C1_20265 [Paenibacillus sp. strain BS8-2]
MKRIGKKLCLLYGAMMTMCLCVAPSAFAASDSDSFSLGGYTASAYLSLGDSSAYADTSYDTVAYVHVSLTASFGSGPFSETRSNSNSNASYSVSTSVSTTYFTSTGISASSNHAVSYMNGSWTPSLSV